MSLEFGCTGRNALFPLGAAGLVPCGEAKFRGDLRVLGSYGTVTGVTVSPRGVIGLLPSGRLKFERFPGPLGVVAYGEITRFSYTVGTKPRAGMFCRTAVACIGEQGICAL